MSIRNLDKAFHPVSIALIAASLEEGGIAAKTQANLAAGGFKGPLWCVAPKPGACASMPWFPDVASLPRAPDLAVIAAPPETLPSLLDALGARGTGAALLLGTASVAADLPGQALRRAILAAARPHLLRVIGPASLGIIVPGRGLNASFAHLAPARGSVALISQSSALAAAALDWARPRRIGFSHVVTLGDVADVDFGDMLDCLASSPEARAILLYAERIRHARKFMSAARAAARGKPVVVVKAGRFATGEDEDAPDAVFDAAFRRAGALRVRSMPELFAAAETLALTRERRGNRLAILTNGTGPGILARDALLEAGGRLAAFTPETAVRLASFRAALEPDANGDANPIDIPGDADPKVSAASLAAVLSDPGVDAALVVHSPNALETSDEVAEALIAALPSFSSLAPTGRNIFTAWLGEETAAPARRRFAEARIPSYASLDEAVSGFMHRVRYRANQDMLMEVPPAERDDAKPDHETASSAIAAALAAGRQWLDPAEAERLLGAYGIPIAPSRAVASGEEAAAAAAAIGGLVALKIRSADIARRGEAGGVALHLEGAAQVRAEGAAMLARIRRVRPEARIEGFLVQEMITRRGAIELAVGLIDGGIFGPVVMFGQGGALMSGETSLELPPLNMALANWQMARARIWPRLQEGLGPSSVDTGAVAQVLIRVAEIACAHAEIEALLIDPLLADADGVIALDARIAVAPARRSAARRLAIPPYPAELETSLPLDDGGEVRVRPIRPEDEPLLQEMFRHMSAEDVRLRFFTAMREMPHALAARLTQIDYDREMAVIALDEAGAMEGVARFAADPDNARAEFAVVVRSDRKRHHIGHLLMTYLLEIAHRRGIGEIFGDVVAENAPMIAFCRALGFSIGPHPADRQLLRVSRPG
ncbi:MAG TPA: bifunctional acetate--CoA ligase family protein/GNAT family N-acetyltransferase [Acetobacteraceae bacterium]|nr:bifunctional acetate--CoA ligase family protein/GNAT family N-acetyltransferase [Acetobacteraceae bacterium]